jgi:hypothetical protein
MKQNVRSKKLVLQRDTLRVLKANELPAAKGGGENTVITFTTTVFTEGACQTYSWWYACPQ